MRGVQLRNTGVLLLLAGACATKPSRVVVWIDEPAPSLVSYRADGGAWKQPTMRSDGAYEFDVDEDFEVVAACVDSDGSSEIEKLAGTASEGLEWHISPSGLITASTGGCMSPGPREGGPEVSVTGEMKQAGDVFLDGTKSSSTANWTFSETVPSGTYDMAALGGTAPWTGKIVLRRDQIIVGPFAEPTIDLSSDGFDLVTAPITISGLDATSVLVDNWFTTANSLAVPLWQIEQPISSSDFATAASVVPASMTTPSDNQYVEVSASRDRSASQLSFQEGHASYSGGSLALALLPVPDASFDEGSGAVAARWSGALPSVSLVQLTTQTRACPTVPCAAPSHVEKLDASAGWLAKHAGMPLSLALYPPQVVTGWRVDLTQPHNRWFTLVGGDSSAWYQSGITDWTGQP